MELYGQRKRNKELAEREAEGEDLWTDLLDKETRYRLSYAVDAVIEDVYRGEVDPIKDARGWALRALGLPTLAGDSDSTNRDFFLCLITADVVVVLTVLEGFVIAVASLGAQRVEGVDTEDFERYQRRTPQFVEDVKTILAEHRVKFDLVGYEFVPFESREMHEEVVVPTLTLLGGDPQFKAAEKAYRKAIHELQGGDPADAITDAATALQVALGALGCDGNTVSKKVKDAVSKGLLTEYDKKLGEWLEADRSTKGDAHNADDADRSDAWLVVHITGALILRVASGPGR